MRRTHTALALFFCLSATGCNDRNLPILAIHLRNDGGAAPQSSITSQQIQLWVDSANVNWTEHGFEFSFDSVQDFKWANSTFLNAPPDSAEESAYELVGNFAAYLFDPDRKRIVVFFRAEGGGGFSWGPSSKNFVSMPSFTKTSISKPTQRPQLHDPVTRNRALPGPGSYVRQAQLQRSQHSLTPTPTWAVRSLPRG
jgi:hypothetical protein